MDDSWQSEKEAEEQEHEQEQEQEEEEDPTLRYEWQRGTAAERTAAIEKRRGELLLLDLAINSDAQREWITLLQERNLMAVEEANAEREAQKDANSSRLSGWLYTKQTKRRHLRYRLFWFHYDRTSGRLYIFPKKESKKPNSYISYIDINRMQAVRTEDADGRRFEIVLDDGFVWQLMAEDFEAMITWMDELRVRKAELQASGFQPSTSRFASGDTVTVSDLSIEEADEQQAGQPTRPVEGLALSHRQEAARALAEVQSAARKGRKSAFGLEESEASEDEDDTGADSKARRQDLRRIAELETECNDLNRLLADARTEAIIKGESAMLMQQRLTTYERELSLKDQALRQLQTQLEQEKEDRERQQRYGLSPEELQSRLAWSQSDLAHTRALLDLFNLRISGAMEAIALYKAVADGLTGTEAQREEIWMAQLAHAQQAIDASEQQNAALREELHAVAANNPNALS